MMAEMSIIIIAFLLFRPFQARSLLAGVSKTIEYYDDEELDAWKGIEPDSYTPEQIELFREIFYTLRPEDVPRWVRSLQLRQIAVPESQRDEILLVVNEQRTIDK